MVICPPGLGCVIKIVLTFFFCSTIVDLIKNPFTNNKTGIVQGCKDTKKYTFEKKDQMN